MTPSRLVPLYLRRLSLTVHDTLIETDHRKGLSVRFDLVHTVTGDSNKAEIEIRNLSPTSRAALTETTVKPMVLLRAGYKDATGILFKGKLSNIEHKPDGQDMVTRIYASDGVEAARGIVNASLAPGVLLADAFVTVAESIIGLDSSHAIARVKAGLFGSTRATGGLSMFGPASHYLQQIAETVGVNVFIHRGELFVLLPGEVRPDEVVKLSKWSGLLGAPARVLDDAYPGKPLVGARAELLPSIDVGRGVVFDSREYQGQFKVLKTRHVGDTHGQDWYIDLEAIRT